MRTVNISRLRHLIVVLGYTWLLTHYCKVQIILLYILVKFSIESFIFNVLIDTSSNFTLERFSQIFRARSDVPGILISDLLDRMLVLPAVDIYDIFMQLTKFEIKIQGLGAPSLKTKLIIIDNVSSPFKLIPKLSYDRKRKIIDKFALDLRRLSARYNCAIFTTNQLTRKLITNAENLDSSLPESSLEYQSIPMLGRIWGSHVDTRICLNHNFERGR